jgi:uncharacterized protein (UPF0332 family)
MTDGQKDLIKYRLQRSLETLEEAKLMFESGHLYGASNRIYYACFYAVTAILLMKNLSSSKHGGTASLFNRHFIKEGLLPVEMGKFYSRMFDSRQESDYGDIVKFDNDQIKNDISQAKDFISLIENFIN